MAKSINKGIVFNLDTEADLLEHLEGKKFGTYVKQLIRADIEKKQTNVDLNSILVALMNGGQSSVSDIMAAPAIVKQEEKQEEVPAISESKAKRFNNMKRT